MSRAGEVLAALRAAHVFDPVPLREDLHRSHVPFDDLVPGADVEARLLRSLGATERVAVSGRSGVGKSSLVAYALDTLGDDVAAIRVPVAAEDEETVSEPAAFAAHLLRSVVREQMAAARSRDRTRELAAAAHEVRVGVERSAALGAGLAWLLRADVGTEVRSVVEASTALSGADVVAAAARLVDTVAARGLRPVIVVGDSDAWLDVPSGDRPALVAPFFGRVVRMLAEEMGAAVVLAVHDDYRGVDGFGTRDGFLEQVVAVPPLPGPGALAEILAARSAPVLAGDPLEVAVAPDAVEAMFAHHRGAHDSIRRTLTLAHLALQVASDDTAERLGASHVAVALTQL